MDDWTTDDIFSIDSSSLFRPETSIFSPNSADSNVCSLSPDYCEAPHGDYTGLDSGYMSSNSSDSGKHSPNGSEGSGEQESYWIYPSSDANAIRRNSINVYNEDTRQNFMPITPITTPVPLYTVKTVSPTRASEAKNLVYIVPSPKNPKNTLPRIKPASTPLTTALPISNATIYVKTEQPTVYVQSDTTTAPLYICQNRMEVSASRVSSSNRTSEEDVALQKMEDRKARNRAAAQASRLRKQNEVEELRATVCTLQQENGLLKVENEALRYRLSKYERVSDNGGAPNRKRIAVAGTIMMALYMVVAIDPIGLGSTSNKPIHHGAAIRTNVPGRVLSAERIYVPPTNNTNNNCVNKKIYNSTEAIRLNSDLYEWVDRHEAMGLGLKGKRRLLHKKQKEWISSVGSMRVNVSEADVNQSSTVETKSPNFKKDKIWRQLDMLSLSGGSSRERREKLRKFIRSDKQGNSAYYKKTYEKLTSAIQQKEDTLYVVALEDYFLLPALERNVTSQPKITLILPSLSYNSTVTGKVALLAIDLRVDGCRPFQLARQLLPFFT